MASEAAGAGGEATKAVLDLSLKMGEYAASIKIDNVWLAAGLGAAAVGIGAFYIHRKYPAQRAIRNALEIEEAGMIDPEVRGIEEGSILVDLVFHTEQTFLSFLDDFEAKRIKLRLEEEFRKIGYEEELEVTITNLDGVYQKLNDIRSSHLGATDNQKRWLVAGIALNKILIPQIRTFVEQDIDKEYNNLKTSHNIHIQSTSGRLARWPPRKFLKYENINENDAHPKLSGGRYNYSLFDCRVLSHVDFAKLYVENYMAKFNAFDDHCDASAVLSLLGGMPVFSAAVQAAAGHVQTARNDWAHCVFSKWDPTKFQQSFKEMEHLVRVMALPAAGEGKILGELKDWEAKDPELLQHVEQNIRSLQDDVKNKSVEFDQEFVTTLKETRDERRERKQRVEHRVDYCHGNPEELVEYIRGNYKNQSVGLYPFLWCEELKNMKLPNIFTRLQIKSRTKEGSKLTDDTVNMTDVFIPHKECDKPRVVLIEGKPAMGKTTYCQKLGYDWSTGAIPPEASFPEVDMLLLLKCRDMNMKTANIEEAIEDQLLPKDADKKEKEKENFFHYIRSKESRILLVLDGLDELRKDLLQGFLPLIQGKDFRHIYLMITARHRAGMRIRRYCDTLLEIVGCTHDDADNYIQRYFSNFEDKSLAGKLIRQLNSDKQLRELTVNPLNTALLCLLQEETGGEFPSNNTKLYDELVSCTLRRYFAKTGASLSDDNPTERCADQLNLLGRVAFEALLKDQMYFSKDEMKNLSADFLHLPFLSSEPSVSKIRPTPCYAFTHKTFQEYFAALYLKHQVLTREKGKVRLLDELNPHDNWQVWEFLFTMVLEKSTERAVTVVSGVCDSALYHQRSVDADAELDVEIFDKKQYDWTYRIDEWMHHNVSGDESALGFLLVRTLELISRCQDGDHELKDYQTEMVQVLANCFPVKRLIIELDPSCCSAHSEYLKFNCTLTNLHLLGSIDRSLLATIENVFHSNHNLVHFGIWDPHYDPVSCASADSIQRISWIKSFLTKVLQVDQLTHLLLNHVWISDEGTKVLAEVLHTNRALTHLGLNETMISDLGAKSLANVLHSNCTLTHLSLPKNWISGIGAKDLASGLQSNSTLVYLDLSANLGGDSVAVALAQALESKCALKYLDLSHCVAQRPPPFIFADSDEVRVEMIGHLGGRALAKALQVNCTLTHLDLNGNYIGDSGALALGEALQTNYTLTELFLEDNMIGESGAEALAKALQSNRTLTHLNLGNNQNTGDSAAVAVAKVLQSNGSVLTRLNLSFNDISCSGAKDIAEALQSNRSLTHLGLSNNAIESFGAIAIAKALKSNRTLTHLHLEGNGIGDSGTKELVQALQYNDTLTYLALRDESIGLLETESLEQIERSKCVVKY